MAQGSVIHQQTGAGMPDVSISNGETFTLTDSQGRFSIPVDLEQYPFIFVNPPAGWRPEQPYYHQFSTAEDEDQPVTFRLAPDPAQEKKGPIRIAHVTDTHVGVAHRPHFVSPDDLAYDLGLVISESQPDLLIVTGDLTDLGRLEDLEVYKQVIDQAPVPTVSLFAGHDATIEWLAAGDHRQTVHAYFLNVMGPDQYCFDWGAYHFILCPELYFEGKGSKGRQTRWFETALSRQPEDKQIIIITHDPPRLYPEMARETYGPSLAQITRHPGAFLLLHGQYHCTRILEAQGVTILGLPSLSMGPIDSSPRGYALLTLEDDRAEIELRPLKTRGQESVVTTTPPAIHAHHRLDQAWEKHLPFSLHRAEAQTWQGHILLAAGDFGRPEHYGVWCLDRQHGEVRWHLPTDSVIKSGVALGRVAGDKAGAIAVAASVAGRIYGFNPADGALRWQTDLPTFPDRWLYSRPIVIDGRVCIANRTSHTALDLQTGAIIWHYNRPRLADNADAANYLAPLAHAGKLIYLQTYPLSLVAVELEFGDILWKKRLDWVDTGLVAHAGRYPRYWLTEVTSPVLAGDLIVTPGIADRLAVVHAETAQTLWQEPAFYADGPASVATSGRHYMGSELAAGLVVHRDRIIASTANGYVYAIDLLSGRRIWQSHTSANPLMDMVPYHRGTANLLSRPTILHESVLLGGSDGYLYQFSSEDGKLLEKNFYGAPITVPPLVTDQGVGIFTFDGRAIWYQ